MAKAKFVFTPEKIIVIHDMKAVGATSAQIAVAIGSKSADSVNAMVWRLKQRERVNVIAPVSDFGDLESLPPRPDVEPVNCGGRIGTIIRDGGVYHAMDARWTHLGWFADQAAAKGAIIAHHDQALPA